MTARFRHCVALLLAALVVLSAVAVTSVGAGPAAAQSAAPTFALAQQSPWIAPGADFSMRFDATGVPVGAQVAVTAHDALQSRTAFDDSIGGDNLPPTRARQEFPFDALPVDPASGQRVLTYPSGALGDNGVYPLEVDLRSANDESLAHFVTHVVVAPVGANGALTVGQPLNVAWVWPLQAEPAYVANIPINPQTLADLKLNGRLGRQAVELLANTDVPLTLAPSPETLDAWAALGQKLPELAAGANVVRASVAKGNKQVLAGPFVPLDLPSIVRGNLQDVVTPVDGTRPGELTRGLAALEQFLGAHVDPSTALPGHLDAASLGILQSASVRQLVVDGNALTPVTEKYTPAHPYKMQTVAGDDASAVTVLATDDGLEQFLTGDAPPALRAAHLLAGLALVAGEQPSISRGIAIANPAQWDADPTLVSAVLAGLRGNPLLHATTVEGLLQAVPVATVDDTPDAAPVFRQLAPYSPPKPPVTAREYNDAVTNRNAVAELVKSPSDLRVAERRPRAGHLRGGRLVESRGPAPCPRPARVDQRLRRGLPRSDRRAAAQHRDHHVEQGRHPDQLPQPGLHSHRHPPPTRERPAPLSQGRHSRPHLGAAPEHDRAGRGRDPWLGIVAGAGDGHHSRWSRHRRRDDQGSLVVRQRCGSLPHRGSDRVPRAVVGLGHPSPAQEARA